MRQISQPLTAGPTPEKAPTYAYNKYRGAVIDGARRDCSAVPSASRRPRLSAYPRRPPEKARPHRTRWATSPTISWRPAHDLRPRADSQTMMEYSLWGFLTVEGTLFRGLTDQGFEAWPAESQGLHGRAIQATLEHGVRDVLCSVQGQSRVPSRGIPSSPRTLSNGSEPRLANLRERFM